jgi:hypothetical protein|tara:strand:- start:2 stop:499 length:498 start_codon:yes stop_codon:yes gene_type:complete
MENFKLTEDYCNNIIKVFSEEETMERFVLKNNRAYERFIIHNNSELKDKYKWLWEGVDNLIKRNLGDNYYLTIWIIVLKYIEGDYFKLHQDRYFNDDDRCLSGGVELSDKNDFEGADYVVKGNPLEFERGKLLTHRLNDLHEITPTKKGTRWSLHFGINKLKTIL